MMRLCRFWERHATAILIGGIIAGLTILQLLGGPRGR